MSESVRGLHCFEGNSGGEVRNNQRVVVGGLITSLQCHSQAKCPKTPALLFNLLFFRCVFFFFHSFASFDTTVKKIEKQTRQQIERRGE